MEPPVNPGDVIVYADETGNPCDSQRHIFGFAGFVGKRDEWRLFAEHWKQTCPPELYPFHMLDFVRASVQDSERQRAVLGPLIELIVNSKIVPIAVVCHVCEFTDSGKPLNRAEG